MQVLVENDAGLREAVRRVGGAGLVGVEAKRKRGASSKKIVFIQIYSETGCIGVKVTSGVPLAIKELMENSDITKVSCNAFLLTKLLNLVSITPRAFIDLESHANHVLLSARCKNVGSILRRLGEHAKHLTPDDLREIFTAPGEQVPVVDCKAVNWGQAIPRGVLESLENEVKLDVGIYKQLVDLKNLVDSTVTPVLVWVGNLPQHVMGHVVQQAFGLHSEPVIGNLTHKESTAVGQLPFIDVQAAKNFVGTWNGKVHGGLGSRVLACALSHDELENLETLTRASRSGHQIYVAEIPHFTRSHQVADFFGSSKASILETRYFTYNGVGIGSAWFESKEAAENAVKTHDGAGYEHYTMDNDGNVRKLVKKVVCGCELDDVVARHIKIHRENDTGMLVGMRVVTLKQLGVAGFGRCDQKGSMGVVISVSGGRVGVRMDSGSEYDVDAKWLEVVEDKEEAEEEEEEEEEEPPISAPQEVPLSVKIAAGARPPFLPPNTYAPYAMGYCRTPHHPYLPYPPPPAPSILISNVPQATDGALAAMCSRAGPVCGVAMNKAKDQAVVSYMAYEHACHAVQMLHNTEHNSRKLHVQMYDPVSAGVMAM
eukprot:TRINITY_DN1952_c0_g3_i1.p1 TRINITY_DN1952_c0_g3~~TRINITY_DN1952_c0_g3_i1.p1  ORF type:complete len:599 (+),score=97.22 TRINITY_DN1952_c0_g3_i1:125-1921(+)